MTTPADFPLTSTCGTVQPSATCSIAVVFLPPITAIASSIDASALEISSNAATSLEFVSLLGSAAATPLQLGATNLAFGSVVLGSTAQANLSLTNTTGLPIALGKMTTTGDFASTGGTCGPGGSSLAAHASCNLIVSFAPSAAGPRSGSLTVASAGTSQPLGATLTGNGIAGRLTTDLTSINFGTLLLHTQTTQSVQLTNTGTAGLSSIHFSLTGA